MMRTILVSILVLFESMVMHAFAQNDWEFISPTLGDVYLADMSLTGDSSFVACGESGQIIIMKDGVLSQLSSGISDDLQGIHFVDSLSGWAVGFNGVIIKSTDGGKTWESQSSGTQTSLHAVHFVDGSLGVAVGHNGVILRTDNGGTIWNRISTSYGEHLYDVQLNSRSVAFASGGRTHILKTTDGGLAWDRVFGSSRGTVTIDGIFMLNDFTGWAVGGNYLYKKEYDNAWHTQANYGGWDLVDVQFLDENIGFVLSGDAFSYFTGRVYKTTDGGDTWKSLGSIDRRLHGLGFAGENIGWAVGGDGAIVRFDEQGLSQLTTPIPRAVLNSVYFLDENTGWIGGEDGHIYHTDDGGTNWIDIDAGSRDVIDILFTTATTGWYLEPRSLRRSEDGGSTWKTSLVFLEDNGVIIKDNYTFIDMIFVDDKTGWVVGYREENQIGNGIIYKTTNGGASWVEQEGSYIPIILSVFALDGNHAWAAGVGGRMIRTSNGGSNWETYLIQGLRADKNLQCLCFVDVSTGWVAGEDGTIFKTSDAGVSWYDQSIETADDFLSVSFVDNQTGWISTNSASLYFTKDGGETWELSEPAYSTTTSFYSVFFLNAQNGWVVGSNGLVLKYVGSNPSSVQSLQGNMSQSFTLAQNYPNPFNPSTTISFQLPKASNATLKILNMLGQEIKTLASKRFEAGSHSVVWDGLDGQGMQVPTGVYLYRIETESFSQTKKLLLLK